MSGRATKKRKDTGAADRSRRTRPGAVAAARKGQATSRWLTGAGVVVVVAFALVLGVIITNRSAARQPGPTSIPTTPITTASGVDSPPPWAAPSDVPAAVNQAGLPLLGSEGAVEHIHAHLDVIVNGQPVTVPADIGIDDSGGTISPLHTHDTTGVIHIESPTRSTFSLAQFFTEWQVRLSAAWLGGLRNTAGAGLHAFVNGQEVAGNPGALPFHAHDEIVLVYGPLPHAVPSTYTWGNL